MRLKYWSSLSNLLVKHQKMTEKNLNLCVVCDCDKEIRKRGLNSHEEIWLCSYLQFIRSVTIPLPCPQHDNPSGSVHYWVNTYVPDSLEGPWAVLHCRESRICYSLLTGKTEDKIWLQKISQRKPLYSQNPPTRFKAWSGAVHLK